MVTFKPIAEFCGVIEINENGEIRSLARNGTPEKILKQTVGTNGYLKVSFRVCGKSYTKNVHRLLAENFIPNQENHPCVNHIDGNKLNNDLSNLEWCSHSTNAKHAFDNGLTKPCRGEDRSSLSNDQVLEIVNLKRDGNTLVGISKMFSISASCVSDIVLGKTWSHITGIKFNPNSHKGKKSATGEKGIRVAPNGKFDVSVFLNGKNTHLIRIADFNEAKEAKMLAEKLICDGKEIKQVVDALRKVFKTKQTE